VSALNLTVATAIYLPFILMNNQSELGGDHDVEA